MVERKKWNTTVPDGRITIAGIKTGTVGVLRLQILCLVTSPMYIPVVRYQFSENVGLACMGQGPYDPCIHCGTYYYLEPGTGIYLSSKKTLITPYPMIAYAYLLGGTEDAINTVIEKIAPAPDMKKRLRRTLTNAINMIQADPFTTMISFRQEDVKSIEQELCALARQSDIDTIIITYPDGLKAGKPEVIDTRARSISFASIVSAVKSAD